MAGAWTPCGSTSVKVVVCPTVTGLGGAAVAAWPGPKGSLYVAVTRRWWPSSPAAAVYDAPSVSGIGVQLFWSGERSHLQLRSAMSPSGSDSTVSRGWSTLGVGAEGVTHPASLRLPTMMVTLMESSRRRSASPSGFLPSRTSTVTV